MQDPKLYRKAKDDMLAQMKQARATLVVAKDRLKNVRVLARSMKNKANQEEKDELEQNLLDFFEEVVIIETIAKNAKIAEASLKGFNHNSKIVDSSTSTSISRSSTQINLSFLEMDGFFDAIDTILSTFISFHSNPQIDSSLIELDSQEEAIKLQQVMKEWGLMIGIQSSLIKALSDELKGIVQKIQ